MGHSYFLFCPETKSDFKLSNCEAVEYNLEINVGKKYLETKKMGILDKYEALETARFMVFKYSDPAKFQQKYLDRDQSLTYYQYKGSPSDINFIYSHIMVEWHLRRTKPYYDYEISGNNCATKILEAIASVEDEDFKFFDNHSFYELDQYLYNFPIYLQDSIEKSGLFPRAIEFSNDGWRSFVVD